MKNEAMKSLMDLPEGTAVKFTEKGSPLVHEGVVERFAKDGNGKVTGFVFLGDNNGWKQADQLEVKEAVLPKKAHKKPAKPSQPELPPAATEIAKNDPGQPPVTGPGNPPETPANN